MSAGWEVLEQGLGKGFPKGNGVGQGQGSHLLIGDFLEVQEGMCKTVNVVSVFWHWSFAAPAMQCSLASKWPSA